MNPSKAAERTSTARWASASSLTALQAARVAAGLKPTSAGSPVTLWRLTHSANSPAVGPIVPKRSRSVSQNGRSKRR